MEGIHVPVMVKEVVMSLDCKPDKIFVDCTVGVGGHSLEILRHISPSGLLIGIDQDEDAIKAAKERLMGFNKQVILIKDNFCNIGTILKKIDIEKVDGFLFDLGVSWLQLNSKDRGFSFKYDSRLDMRMDKQGEVTASDILNTKSCEEIDEIIKKYGEERWSYRIAKNIVEYRKRQAIKTTAQLVDIIISSMPSRYRYSSRIHPATRTFQALRIAVNDELNVLEKTLTHIIDFLSLNGRICVISFHSLEDRIVKNIFNSKSISKSGKGIQVSTLPFGSKGILKVLTKRPVRPSQAEITLNPKARSAKLRAAIRVN